MLKHARNNDEDFAQGGRGARDLYAIDRVAAAHYRQHQWCLIANVLVFRPSYSCLYVAAWKRLRE